LFRLRRQGSTVSTKRQHLRILHSGFITLDIDSPSPCTRSSIASWSLRFAPALFDPSRDQLSSGCEQSSNCSARRRGTAPAPLLTRFECSRCKIPTKAWPRLFSFNNPFARGSPRCQGVATLSFRHGSGGFLTSLNPGRRRPEPFDQANIALSSHRASPVGRGRRNSCSCSLVYNSRPDHTKPS